jgi:hypothetical protein
MNCSNENGINGFRVEVPFSFNNFSTPSVFL